MTRFVTFLRFQLAANEADLAITDGERPGGFFDREDLLTFSRLTRAYQDR